MRSPWLRKYIVICLLILLWEPTEAESFFAVSRKADPPIDDLMKVINAQIRYPDIQKELSINMKLVTTSQPTMRVLWTTTEDEDLTIEIPKQDFARIEDSNTSAFKKKTLDFRKHRIALQTKDIAEGKMYPKTNSSSSTISKAIKASNSRFESRKTTGRKGRVHYKVETVDITDNANGDENDRNTGNEEEEECLTEMTLVDEQHDNENESETSVPDKAWHREDTEEQLEEHKTDPQLNGHNETDSSTPYGEDQDSQVNQECNEGKEKEEKSEEQFNRPSKKGAGKEENIYDQLSQVNNDDREDYKIMKEQCEGEQEEDDGSDSQLSDQEEEESMDMPEMNEEEYSTETMKCRSQRPDIETTSSRRPNDKERVQTTGQPSPPLSGVTPSGSSSAPTANFTKEPYKSHGDGTKLASFKKDAIAKISIEKGRQIKNKVRKENSGDSRKTFLQTRTKKSINKPDIFLKKYLFLDDDNRKSCKKKYAKKKGNGSKKDSLKKLISQIKRMTSEVPGEFHLAKSDERMRMEGLEDSEDADYGDDYIEDYDEGTKAEFYDTPNSPSIPPELQDIPRLESSEDDSLETVASRIYQAARSLRNNIEVKEEGIRKIEEEERLLTTGITNLQDILQECQSLKAGLDSVRTKSVARLRGLLQASELQNQVHVKLGNKIKEILRLIDVDAINDKLKHT